MRIDEIKFIESKFLFSLKLENDEEFNISYESYEKYNINKESEIDEKLYEILKAEDEFNKAKAKAVFFCEYKMRTENEVRNRLYRDKINNNVVNKVIDFLYSKMYIDDEKYAEEFFSQCINLKKYSLLKTRQKLMQKGINKKLIDKLQEMNDTGDIEYANALESANKKARNVDLEDPKQYQKVYMYLVRNGFSYNLSKSALEKVKNEKRND